MNGHVSTLDLDVYFASPDHERAGSDGSRIRSHVDTCAQCRAYLDELDALAGEIDLVVPAAPPRKAKVTRLVPAAVTALALAAGALLYVRTRPVDDGAYVGVKGGAFTQVLVRSHGAVRLWDGASAVRAGDALAVRVGCDSFAHVTVASNHAVRAWEGPCSAPGDTPLPFTLVVDGQPGRERFSVVMSRDRLDDDALRGAIRGGTRNDAVWVTTFDLAKEE